MRWFIRHKPSLPKTVRNIRRLQLIAFQQGEDSLALLHHLGDEATREDAALDASRQTLNLSLSQYRDGMVSYLDVVTSQTTELNTEIASLELRARRMGTSVNSSRRSAAARLTIDSRLIHLNGQRAHPTRRGQRPQGQTLYCFRIVATRRLAEVCFAPAAGSCASSTRPTR